MGGGLSAEAFAGRTMQGQVRQGHHAEGSGHQSGARVMPGLGSDTGNKAIEWMTLNKQEEPRAGGRNVGTVFGDWGGDRFHSSPSSQKANRKTTTRGFLHKQRLVTVTDSTNFRAGNASVASGKGGWD